MCTLIVRLLRNVGVSRYDGLCEVLGAMDVYRLWGI